MLALGQFLILPAMVMTFAILLLAVWILVKSFKEKHSKQVFQLALLSIFIGVLGIISVAIEIIKDWPPANDAIMTLVFWGLPFFAGVVALIKTLTKSR